jgi:hypothetical protein
LNILKRDIVENEEAQIARNVLENVISIGIVVAPESSWALKSKLIVFSIRFRGLSHSFESYSIAFIDCIPNSFALQFWKSQRNVLRQLLPWSRLI